MLRNEYELIENYMLSCMTDSAHDKEHVYRVLYVALDIASHEVKVDYDILITACLLHDIGRTLFYKAEVSEPLYTILEDNTVCDGSDDQAPSFFHEYKYKLENIYDKFYTGHAKKIAKERQSAAVNFYNNMLNEVTDSYKNGVENLSFYVKDMLSR